jgi:hypothetical protein
MRLLQSKEKRRMGLRTGGRVIQVECGGTATDDKKEYFSLTLAPRREIYFHFYTKYDQSFMKPSSAS